MKKSFDDYTRLAGSHGMKGSLWLGPDHLLVIEGKGFILPFKEQYRRIDYANIQALIMVKRPAWLWWLVTCGIGALIFALMSISAWQEIVGLGITFALISLVLGLFAMMQLIKGPTCHSFIQTAVQVLRLKPLGRMRSAHVAFRELESLCQEHQSHIPLPPTGSEPMHLSPPLPHASPSTAAFAQTSSKKPWTGSAWVWTAATLTLVWGIMIAAELYVPQVWFLWLSVTVGVVAFVSTLIGLVTVVRSLVPAALTIFLAVALALQFVAGTAFYFALSIVNATAVDIYEQMQMHKAFNRLAAFESNGTAEYVVIPTGLLLALVGLLILPNARARVKVTDIAQPAAPPSFNSPAAADLKSGSNEEG